MKKLMLFTLTFVISCGCSRSEHPQDTPTEIKLTAGVTIPNATRAPIDTWADTEIAFAKGTATQNYTHTWEATVSVDGKVTLLPAQLYNPTETFFLRGYTPRGRFSDGEVWFEGMDGTQDILLSDEKSGSLAAKFNGTFAFAHQLAQLNFTVQCNEAYGTDKVLTAIEVNGTRLPVSMQLTDGTITYTAQTVPIVAFAGTQSISQTVSKPFGAVMIEPGAAITLTLIANGKTYKDLPVAIAGGGTPQVGTAYTLAIVISGDSQVSLSATITPWLSGSGEVII